MTHNAANQIYSRVDDKELYLERTFNAPRALVFKAFSQAEHLKRWWGPKGWTLPVCNIDFRPGGEWHYCMKCEDEKQEYFGYESWGKAEYKEIVEPERIVYVDSFSDAEGNINEGMPQTIVTMTFEELDGKTKLINHGRYASAEALKSVLDMGMLQGITETFNNLDALL